MNFATLILTVFFAATNSTPAFAQAEQKIVPVIWANALPATYIEILKKCGFTPVIGPQPRPFPVEKLLCAGVLNESAAQELMNRALKTVDKLIELGVRQIADVDLADLRARMTTVQMRISDWGIFESVLDSPGTPRRFAVNVEEIRTVILNAPFWKLQQNSEFADAFLIHEILGALGHRDEQYQVTLTIWYLARNPARMHPLMKELPGFIKKMQPQDFAKISVVGHGGDSNQLAFKASLLALTEKQISVDAPAKYIPTREKIEALILTSPISSASAKFMLERNLCDKPGGGQSLYFCSGFTIKGATGTPFLLIADEWGTFGENALLAHSLTKVYTSIVRDLICTSGFSCPNKGRK